MYIIHSFVQLTYNAYACRCTYYCFITFSLATRVTIPPSCAQQAASSHAWYIHEGAVKVNETCTDHAGERYNPYGVNTTEESGYLDDCSSLRQQRCAMGDLTGKLGALGLEPVTTSPHQTYSFYDENLHLLGPFTSEFIRPMSKLYPLDIC